MIRKLYHGSSDIIEKPKYGYGKSYNDYGRGFYCTGSIEMAKEWGVGKDQDGYANAYELDCTGLNILDLNSEEYGILHWLAVLLQNREFDVPSGLALEAKEYLQKNFSVNYDEYDAIIGYRADDSYFSFAQDFISGAISYQQLEYAMQLGKLGRQVVLVSRKAFSQIKYLDTNRALRLDWLEKKKERDRKARADYLQSDRMRYRRGDLYVVQILDEEMTPEDPRLL